MIRRCRRSSPQGASTAALGEQSHFAIGQDFNLADNSVAAVMLSRTRKLAWPERVMPHAQRICILYKASAGSVSANSSCGCARRRLRAWWDARPISASDGLVVSERFAGTRIRLHPMAPDYSWCRRRRRDAVRNSVGGARAAGHRRCDCEVSTLPPGHCRRWAGINNCPFGSDDPNGAHQPGCGRNIFCQQTTEDVETGGVGDGFDCIDTAGHLRIASGEIDGDERADGSSTRLGRSETRPHTPSVLAGSLRLRSGPGSDLAGHAHRHSDLHRLVGDAVVIEKVFGHDICRRHVQQKRRASVLRNTPADLSPRAWRGRHRSAHRARRSRSAPCDKRQSARPDRLRALRACGHCEQESEEYLFQNHS